MFYFIIFLQHVQVDWGEQRWCKDANRLLPTKKSYYLMEEQRIVKYFKRKSRTSSSGSDKTPPKKNKQKEDLSLVYSESDESALVDEALDMAQNLGNKLDQDLAKLDTLETRVAEIHNDMLEINKRTTEEVNRLDGKIAQLEEGANYVTKDVNDLKMNLDTAYKKVSKEVEQLKLKLLNMNVYQRRENLRFYGIKETESPESGNTEVILKDFNSDVLDERDAWGIKFQRVHRVGKPIPGKPRPIIARSKITQTERKLWL